MEVGVDGLGIGARGYRGAHPPTLRRRKPGASRRSHRNTSDLDQTMHTTRYTHPVGRLASAGAVIGDERPPKPNLASLMQIKAVHLRAIRSAYSH